MNNPFLSAFTGSEVTLRLHLAASSVESSWVDAPIPTACALMWSTLPGEERIIAQLPQFKLCACMPDAGCGGLIIILVQIAM